MPERGRRPRRRTWICLALLGVVLVVVVPAYLTVPRQNNTDPRVDALLVLGSPTDIHGSLTSAQRWRVDEAIREFRAGRAPRMVMSGGMTTPGYVEADTMAQYARSQGIPASAILEERESKTTLENIRNCQRLLAAHGWRRVEVISSPEHLPRAALLLGQSDLLWRVHAAPTPGRNPLQIAGAYAEEAVGTAVIRLFGTRAEPFLHAYAYFQGRIIFAAYWVAYRVRVWLHR